MSFRVQIENFQSVVSADLEVSGLTTITGQNNSGKSAIMRAIRGVFTNPGNGTNYIHYGKDHFRVRIDFDDGKYVLWERLGRRATKGKSKGELVDIKTNYEVNGVRYEGVANSVPDEVLEQGVGPITIGREQVWPQLAKQVKDVFFLVDKPGSHIAEAVANVDNVAVLNAAMRDCDKDLRANGSELKLRQKDLQGHKDKLEAMAGLDVVVERVEAVEELHKQVTRIQTGITTVTALRDRLFEARADVEKLAPVLDIAVPDDDRVTEIKTTIREIRESRELRQRLEDARAVRKRYAGADELSVPEAELALDLRGLIEEVEEARKLKVRLGKARDLVARLAPAEALSEVDLDAGLVGLKKVAKGLEVYGGLQEKLYRARNLENSLSHEVYAAEQKVEKIQVELDEFLAANPKCPECGQYRLDHQEAS